MTTEAPERNLPALPDYDPQTPLTARKPIIDQMDDRYLKLIQATRLKGLDHAELGMVLELAAYYQLDAFSGEIWGSKSQGRDGRPGQLLIMVGRDGLRKIVMRNKLEMDGDVIRENDEFEVFRERDRTRTVRHAYKGVAEKDRGKIVGAWAEVWDADGKQRGFFVAPIEEYVPTSEGKLRHSPWGAQVSVMILAAAERQAARQSTPLSGLLMEGETALNEERAELAGSEESDAAIQAVIDSVDAEPELQDRLYDAITEANRLAPNSYPAAKVQMVVAGKKDETLLREVENVEAFVEHCRERAEAAAAEEPPEAEVVDGEPVEEDARPATEEEAAGQVAAEAADRDVLQHQVADLEAAIAEADEGSLERAELEAKLEEVTAQLAALDE